MACQCELLFSVTLEEFHAQLGAAEPLELERREAGDGVVDQEELATMLQKMLAESGLAFDDAAISAFVAQEFATADTDGDNQVDFDEFKKIMLYKPPAEPSGSLPQEKAE